MSINKCKECGKIHETDNQTFCPKCNEKKEKRDHFRSIMVQLKEITDLPYPDNLFMSGFSYAEIEQFSLVLLQLLGNYNFPIKISDFVNENARKKAEILLGGI